MRIRSVKPDYWAHKMHSVICESSSLLGLALLNISDDEGYTDFTPSMMHGVVFSRRAPTMPIEACLDELRRVDYLGWIDCPVDGIPCRIYHVKGFLRHQVINKAQPSRLAPHYSAAVNGLPPPKSQPVPVVTPATLPDQYGNELGEGRKEGRIEGMKELKTLEGEAADAAPRPPVNEILEYLNMQREPESPVPAPPESPKKVRAVFVEPDYQAVVKFVTDEWAIENPGQIGMTGADQLRLEIEKFLDHFGARGWKTGNVKMTDWKKAFRNWIRRVPDFQPKPAVIIRGRR